MVVGLVGNLATRNGCMRIVVFTRVIRVFTGVVWIRS